MNRPIRGSGPRNRLTAFRTIGWMAVVSMLAMALLGPGAGAALGASVTPIFVEGAASNTCSDFAATAGGGQTWLESKKDPNADGVIVVPSFGTITISNTLNDKTFDWSSTFGIDAVYVKGGKDGSYLYVYAPTALSAESFGDTNLTSPGQNEISHISFCYDESNPTPPAHLTLAKVVVNTGGGSASAGDWTLSATGPTTLSGAGGDSGDVPAGTYSLAESAGPANYTAGDWVCVGGAQEGSSITLAPDESATCTITNTYSPPPPGSITIIKNTLGGQDGTFDFTGPSGPFSITTVGGTGWVTFSDLSDDSYTVTESGPTSDWTFTGLYCTSDEGSSWSQDGQNPQQANIDLASDGTVTCTFTNTYTPPSPPPGSITIIKHTIGGDGTFDFDATGSGMPGPFQISTSGGTGSHSFTELQSGMYEISEPPLPSGWAWTSLLCVTPEGSSAQLSNEGPAVTIRLGAGDSVVCTFTNTFTPPTNPPTNPPTPTPNPSPSPSPSPTGAVEGATSQPTGGVLGVTAPPTDTLGGGTPSAPSDGWRLGLLAMAALLATALVLTPSPKRERRK